MSNNQKFEFKINSSPHLKMSQITKQLFNRNFHADVQFSIGDQVIYAHSLELIKRSVVFEQELGDKMGDVKLIPIIDCKYESFYEFIRYIYTDECTINEDNFIDILKLTTKYKFIKLENEVIKSGVHTIIWRLKCFEHCILHKYDLLRNFSTEHLSLWFSFYLEQEQFLSLHPDAVDELLKFERVKKDVSELQIFTGAAKWIKSNCNKHQISLSEGRQRWDKLIRKIRFPTLSIDDLRECYAKYPGLLNDSDRMSIASQAVFGGSDSENDLWISKGREEYTHSYEWRIFHHDTIHETIFSVSEDTILHGLRIGIDNIKRRPIEIEISENDDEIEAIDKIMFKQNTPAVWSYLIISLGESLLMKPNLKYTIRIKYLETEGNVGIWLRPKNVNVIINDPAKTVNLIQASGNMIEMFFKPVTN